ncbi:MAG: CD225/dispanin family protein, partial [Actinomycetota bacterium]|nr:CD225/dispanin family protein [Actinomycetota bacterium]
RMLCPGCGTENKDSNYRCTFCGRELHATEDDPRFRKREPVPPPVAQPVPTGPFGPSTQRIRSYLVPSIFATLCCCLPTGVVALVYAVQVNGKLARGDFVGATRASNNARTWCLISFVLGISLFAVSQFTNLGNEG